MKYNSDHKCNFSHIVVDAINISTGGGLVLLKYLCDELINSSAKFVLVVDTKKNAIKIEGCAVVHCDNSLLARYKFYAGIEDELKPDVVFCFGNFPPPLRLSCRVYTYFHRPALAKMNLHLASWSQRMSYRAKRFLLWAWRKNTRIFIFQSAVVRENFIRTYGQSISTKIIPFYNTAQYDKLATEKSNSSDRIERFIYVSNDAPHKNHGVLLDAWEELHGQGIHPQLLLTLPLASQFEQRVHYLNEKGCNIVNVGQLDHQVILDETKKSKYVIFPSIAETLGLGLVEGFYLGCHVIAADLPYTQEVVIPSFKFNPFSSSAIASTVLQSLKTPITSDTELVLDNKINDLLQLLLGKTLN
jgi:glycosyltransferase involved in cell wall biosynthesis